MASVSNVSSLTGYPLPQNNSSLSPADFDAQHNTYLELLTRLTTYRSSQTESGRCCATITTDRVMARILDLPTEIRLYILSFLDASDLLSLRATCHDSHTFVHESEAAICKAFPSRVSDLYDIKITPIEIPTFAACIKQDLKYSAIWECADFVGRRICTYARDPRYSNDRRGLARWRLTRVPRMVRRIMRSFILLQHYLDLFKHIIISNDPHFRCLESDDYKSLRNVYDLDQQQALETHMSWLTEQDFHDITAALGIIRSICHARKVSIELKGNTYPFASIRSILILLGIPAIRDLWARPATDINSNRPSEQLEHLQKKLSPYHRPDFTKLSSSTPLPTIYHLDGSYKPRELFHEPASHLRIKDDQETFLQRQDLWLRAARSFMMRKFGEPVEHQSTSTWIQLALLDSTQDVEYHRRITLGPWDMAVPG